MSYQLLGHVQAAKQIASFMDEVRGCLRVFCLQPAMAPPLTTAMLPIIAAWYLLVGAENQKLLEQTADIQRETGVTCSGFRTLHSEWSVSCQAPIG